MSYKITNPLVTAVIIGEYSDSRLPSIKTANKDYQNIIDSFHDTYGYTVFVAQNDKNDEDYTLARFSSSGDAPQIQSCNFKCKWTTEEIEDFNEKIKEDFIDNDSINFDSLIYIISCHGDGKSGIYDSKGENLFLSDIYSEFDNHQCRDLRDKPKIYLLDTYRIGGGNNNSSIDKNDTNTNNQEEENKMDVSVSDIVVTKNNLKNTTIPIPAAATYTTDTHFREIFGNSGHQPISNVNETIGHSIFIQCLTQIIKRNPSVNLCDILVKTRSSMSAMLKLDENSDVNAIVLSDVSTMPYKVNFGQRKVHTCV